MNTTTTLPVGSGAPPAAINRDNENRARLYSLDALRGFDMFWIMGGGSIFHAISKASGSFFWAAIDEQLEHPAWNGFHFYDLIFPLFLFMAGVSTPYSVGRELEKGKSRNRLLGLHLEILLWKGISLPISIA